MKTLYFNNNVIVYNTRPIFDLLIIIISREIKNNHFALFHSVQCFLDHISWKQLTDGTLCKSTYQEFNSSQTSEAVDNR